ncbi:MAG: MBL fold metallo-hydrolase [Actinobacteria bacterium]|nr:MBL fold metallo-hydrolase [Actinomycetota bacterium]MDA2961799.1 MBL fold metallo-hydrolase [Actinomycetota bacterium]MDA2995135.1 MBL fold metallo-hydrolase [Actinomycetota bacterium]
MNIVFHGVRGSTPCHCPEVQRYGGNTSCVSLLARGQAPLVFDLGTGLRYFGGVLSNDVAEINVLVSHLHWDHIQGLPFLPQLQRSDCSVNIWAPAQQDGRTAHETLDAAITQPMFPVSLAAIGANISVHDVEPSMWRIGAFEVRAVDVPHIGPTLGYRVSLDGRSVVYISDHQEPSDSSQFDPKVLELCDKADVLIHDAQFTDVDYVGREHWGHCRIDYAFSLAVSAGVATLVLFHHDPSRSDDELDAIEAEYKVRGLEFGVEVVVAREGMEMKIPCHADAHA